DVLRELRTRVAREYHHAAVGHHLPPSVTGVCGWGARIRTWEWRDQNPLPYHLATPQRYTAATGSDRARRFRASGPADAQARRAQLRGRRRSQTRTLRYRSSARRP